MRFALFTASLFVSSQALACGMYIPPEMKVASIGSLMDTLDAEEKDDGFVDIAAEDAKVDVPVQAVGFQGIVLDVNAEPEPTREQRKQARKARKNAPNS